MLKFIKNRYPVKNLTAFAFIGGLNCPKLKDDNKIKTTAFVILLTHKHRSASILVMLNLSFMQKQFTQPDSPNQRTLMSSSRMITSDF